MLKAPEKLAVLAWRHDVALRESGPRVTMRAAIMVGRYSRAHQLKQAATFLPATSLTR